MSCLSGTHKLMILVGKASHQNQMETIPPAGVIGDLLSPQGA